MLHELDRLIKLVEQKYDVAVYLHHKQPGIFLGNILLPVYLGNVKLFSADINIYSVLTRDDIDLIATLAHEIGHLESWKRKESPKNSFLYWKNVHYRFKKHLPLTEEQFQILLAEETRAWKYGCDFITTNVTAGYYQSNVMYYSKHRLKTLEYDLRYHSRPRIPMQVSKILPKTLESSSQ